MLRFFFLCLACNVVVFKLIFFIPQLIAFCESVQRRSPVGAHIRPVPGLSSGYGDHEVIFADGTFTEGSTLELSADGPLREPYAAYSQVSVCCFSVCLLISLFYIRRSIF